MAASLVSLLPVTNAVMLVLALWFQECHGQATHADIRKGQTPVMSGRSAGSALLQGQHRRQPSSSMAGRDPYIPGRLGPRRPLAAGGGPGFFDPASSLGGLIGRAYQRGELTMGPHQPREAPAGRQPAIVQQGPEGNVLGGRGGAAGGAAALDNGLHLPSQGHAEMTQPDLHGSPLDPPANSVYKENRVVPGLIQEQWTGGGQLNLTCQKVLWPTHLLELCDFDPLYRIVGQRAPSITELLKLTRHYGNVFSQIRTHGTELCADAAVEHICQQQVPRCEQSSVNAETGMAVWSVTVASTQCYKVHRYCQNPAAKRVLDQLQICSRNGMITGRYELNTCSSLAQVQQQQRRPAPRSGPFFRGPMRSCTARMSPRVRVPNFQLPLYQKDWEMNQHIAQLQRAASSGMLPLLCRQAVHTFSCAPEQQCTADGRRIIPGRTKEQCLAVDNCLENSMFRFGIDCGALPSEQSVADLDLRPPLRGSIRMKKERGRVFPRRSAAGKIARDTLTLLSTIALSLLLAH